MAEQLAARGWLPDLILCSDSTRTKQTLQSMRVSHRQLSLSSAALHFARRVAVQLWPRCMRILLDGLEDAISLRMFVEEL